MQRKVVPESWRRWGGGLTLTFVAVSCCCARPADAAPRPPAAFASGAEASPPSPRPAAEEEAILRDTAAGTSQRSAAAQRLLLADDAESRNAATAILGDSVGSSEVRAILLREIAAMSVAPPWLLEPLRALLEVQASGGGGSDHRAAALSAIGSIRTREAVDVLIQRLDGDPPELPRGAARALARLTGRTDLGLDPSRWRAWFARVQWLPESEWRRTLADGLARTADQAQRERDRAVARLIETLQREYLAIFGAEERTRLLAQFLGDEMPDVRRLGVQLVRQELANARMPGPAVGTAVVKLLADPAPEFRRAAADILGILSIPDEGESLARALVVETDPSVAEVMLQAVARSPTPGASPVVMRWLTGDRAVREAAIAAAAALHGLSMLASEEECAKILDVLRGGPAVRDLSSAGLRLLCQLGDQNDRDAVAALLSDEDPIRRLRAAEALGTDVRGVDALLSAAADDPMFFAPAARATATLRPTIAGYRAIAARPPEGEGSDARRDGLLALAARLSIGDLVTAARATDDPAFREGLLARLANERFERQRLPRTEFTAQPELVAGLLLLARTRMALGLPAAALAALDALEPIASRLRSPDRVAMRTTTLLWLGRVDEAIAMNGPLTAWIDGLERSIDLPHARSVLAAMDRVFGTDIRPAAGYADTLAALRARLGPPAPGPPVSPPPTREPIGPPPPPK